MALKGTSGQHLIHDPLHKAVNGFESSFNLWLVDMLVRPLICTFAFVLSHVTAAPLGIEQVLEPRGHSPNRELDLSSLSDQQSDSNPR